MTRFDASRLPSYTSHRVKCALRIGSMEGCTMYPADDRYQPFEVSWDYVKKHSPQAGGYWIAYEDGYESFCPAPQFEASHTPVDGGEVDRGFGFGAVPAVEQADPSPEAGSDGAESDHGTTGSDHAAGVVGTAVAEPTTPSE